MDRELQDQIGKMLDDALHEVLNGRPETSTAARTRRLRLIGAALLSLAIACGIVFAFLSVGQHPVATRVALVVAAGLPLIVGAWLTDRAANDERRELHMRLSGVIHSALSETLAVSAPVRARLQRQHGICILVMAGFCVCVTVVPLLSNQLLDVALWGATSTLLTGMGAWNVLSAVRQAARAQAMVAADLHRQSAKAGRHIQRVR